MSVSKLLPAGGNNDFNVSVTGTYTVVTFTKEYSAGSYTLTSSLSDSTYDIYVFNSDGSSAGYTKTPSLSATKGFNKMVILGGTNGDLLSFVYKTTYTTENETAEVTAGPVITSVSPSDMPKVNDTITVTGRNFATDVAITFSNSGTGYGPTSAKSIVRSSATSLIVTRPDTFPVATSAYTITASNPGITNPTGTNSHILASSITAGNAPVWSTSATLPAYTKNVAYSTTLVATDSSDSGSAITYSMVSGLPTGFSLASTSGVLSGTSTSSVPLTSIVVRATDSGGNYVDRTFTIPNSGPVWTTTGALTGATSGSAYTYTLLAPDDSGATPTFSLYSGSLPTGLTLASTSGVISGTPTVGSNGTSSTFVVTATDANGTAVNSGTLSLYVYGPVITRYTSSGTFTPGISQTITVALVAGGGSGGLYAGGGNVGSGGGGAGGVVYATYAVTAGTTYTYTIGGGGAAIPRSGNTTLHGNKGTNSTFTGFTTAVGGGAGGGSQISASGWNTSPFTGYGGSGGGGGESYAAAQGTAGQGNNGGTTPGQWCAAGGGGAGGVGSNSTGSSGGSGGNGGAGVTYLTYTLGGGGAGGSGNGTGGTASSGGGNGGQNTTPGGNGTAYTGGGGGGSGSNAGSDSGAGGSGCIIIQALG